MREIKFRAWDKDNKRYLEEYDVVRYSDSTVGVHDSSPPFNRYGVVILEQYTGLKDKNGVEIYEGDIVKDNIFGLYTVFFSYGGFKLIGVNELSNQLALMDSHSNWYEVIGNIYENPELMEEV